MANSPRKRVHTSALVFGAALLVAALAMPVGAQSSRHVPLPTDGAAPITWSSRVIHNWYETETVHVFLMIDGFKVRQGKWSLTARDGIVWFDERTGADGGRKVLGIYAEDKVVVTGPEVSAPCTAPLAPPSDCSSTTSGMVPQIFFAPAADQASAHSPMGLEGVIG